MRGWATKYFFPGFLTLALGFISSCEDLNDNDLKSFASIDTEYFEMDFDVEPTDKTGLIVFSEEFFEGNLDIVLEDAGFDADKLEKVSVEEALVNLRETVHYPDFDIVKFIELTAFTESEGESMIAWVDPVPSGKRSLTLDVSDSDVLRYFRETEFGISVRGFLKQNISDTMRLHAKVKFKVTVLVD